MRETISALVPGITDPLVIEIGTKDVKTHAIMSEHDAGWKYVRSQCQDALNAVATGLATSNKAAEAAWDAYQVKLKG